MVKRKTRLSKLCLTAAASLFFVSCASSSQNSFEVSGIQVHDPFEDANRVVFEVNEGIDNAFINPLILGYREVVPEPGRDGVSNFLQNLKSPVHFANQLLQGDVDGAGTVVLRTVINTFVGLGGIFDVAGAEGIEHEPEDFGQTLAVWGVGHGPYLVVPILGPSSLRDYVGYAVDSFADPLRWYLHNIDEEQIYYAKLGADYLDLRNSLIDVLQDLEASSIDYYAAVRSTYYQRREAMIRDEEPDSMIAPEIPDFDDI